MNGGGRRLGCRFQAELIDPSDFKGSMARGRARIPWIWMALVLMSAYAGWAQDTGNALPVRAVPTCLSISPFRALSTLGNGSSSPEDLRDQVIAALRGQLDSGWIARAAGACPEAMAVLDIFQMPSDVVPSADGPNLRIRLEWHHQAGQTELFLSCPKREPPSVSVVAEQLRAVARQMAARLELHSSPEGAALHVTGFSPFQEEFHTPMVLKSPPGAFSVEFSLNGLVRRMDTVVVTGGLYDIHADFRAARIDPKVRAAIHRTWPWWSATAVSAAAAIFFEWKQSQAQIAYSSLGSTDSQARFAAKWRDLRDANLLRNGFLGLTLILGTGSAWLEWGQGR